MEAVLAVAVPVAVVPRSNPLTARYGQSHHSLGQQAPLSQAVYYIYSPYSPYSLYSFYSPYSPYSLYSFYSPYSLYSIYRFYLFLLMCSYYPKKAYLCSDFLTRL